MLPVVVALGLAGCATGGHSDPASPVLLALALILLLAKIGGDVCQRIGLPSVLGELSVGVALGNWYLLTGLHGLDFVQPGASRTGEVIDMLARLGVVLLLFDVGLGARTREILAVGLSSLLVALLGVIAPFLLGWGAGVLLLPEASWHVHVFLGATLCATSVGVTARVLQDLDRIDQRESKIILGAAVMDDVLGLLVLALVSGLILSAERGPGSETPSVLATIVYAVSFIAAALALGALEFPRILFRAASYLRGRGLLVATALVICFAFAYAASLVGLAPIIGAFAAGLILDEAHYQEENGAWKDRQLEDALAPLNAVLVPIFFVSVGMQVDLARFQDPSVWSLAAVLTVAAIVGKQLCALGVREPGLNRTAVGLGMIPRGEVGLIFAAQGQELFLAGAPVIDRGTYSALVIMILITTVATPPLLRWSLNGDAASTNRAPP